MDHKDHLAEEVRKAGKAKDVLDHEAFKDAFDTVEEALLMAMRQSPIADEKLRLRLLDKYEALHALLGVLQSMVETGLMAEEELRQKSMAERMKDFLNIN